MRKKTNHFVVNGKPLLVPDTVDVIYTDLDSDDSGRDEAGFMHRIVLREKVPTWSFTYETLTEEERKYMESLFKGYPTFTFHRPNLEDSGQHTAVPAYRSVFSISWFNAKQGLWKNYKFNIIEC